MNTWDDHYAADHLPWDTGVPDEHLVATAPRPGRALEIGCGTGTNAAWLARHGFNVVAIDVAPRAIARARARTEGLAVELLVADVLHDALPGPFDFIFDRGVFHIFDEAAHRERFAARVASVLAPGGRWLSLVGSTEGPARDTGPPRRSARDIVSAIEPHLAILELVASDFSTHGLGNPPAWRVLAAARVLPAQPSTRLAP